MGWEMLRHPASGADVLLYDFSHLFTVKENPQSPVFTLENDM